MQSHAGSEPGRKARRGADRFNMLDFIALVLARQFQTPSAVTDYASRLGGAELRAFVSRNQRKLASYIARLRRTAMTMPVGRVRATIGPMTRRRLAIEAAKGAFKFCRQYYGWMKYRTCVVIRRKC